MTTDISKLESEIARAKTLNAGDSHYRAYVGPPDQYDIMGAAQFCLLFRLGLREEHYLLDLGCGSLRAGRFLIQLLLPNRYYGTEPNEWLWQHAIHEEVGADLFQKKSPMLSADGDFSFKNFGVNFDFILAQSIFSHTGTDLMRKGLKNAAGVLKPTGQLLFTVLDETTSSFGEVEDARTKSGWVYPACVNIPEKELNAICSDVGLFIQPVSWFHQRQRWYRATLSPNLLLDTDQLAELGTGRPLFNSRS